MGCSHMPGNVVRTHLVSTFHADSYPVWKGRTVAHLVAFEVAKGYHCLAVVAIDDWILVPLLVYAEGVQVCQHQVT
jgi:hypothetical protein